MKYQAQQRAPKARHWSVWSVAPLALIFQPAFQRLRAVAAARCGPCQRPQFLEIPASPYCLAALSSCRSSDWYFSSRSRTARTCFSRAPPSGGLRPNGGKVCAPCGTNEPSYMALSCYPCPLRTGRAGPKKWTKPPLRTASGKGVSSTRLKRYPNGLEGSS